jgi:23S rRNA (adenine2503-C2)-methyltransferase
VTTSAFTSTAPRTNIGDLSLPELTAELALLGLPPYRAKQVWGGLYHRLAASFDQISELPVALRQTLEQRFRMLAAEPVVQQSSRDTSTQKALLRLSDGELIETVLMRYPASEQGRARNTVCVSTQAGCAMACSFCATGQQGFRRNLSPAEIIEQVLHFARGLQGEHAQVTNVVFMGMGEPLANYAATLQAVATLNSAGGFGLGARHITISTVGVMPGIRRLAQEPFQVGLALSLHAPNDELRRRLIPTARQPVRALLDACNDYARVTGRRYSIEYALIEHVNDSPALAFDLGRLLQSMPCHVNLIPVNPTSNQATRRPGRARVIAFQRELLAAGINCTVRVEKGVDIMAGCGQLRGTAGGGDAIALQPVGAPVP